MSPSLSLLVALYLGYVLSYHPFFCSFYCFLAHNSRKLVSVWSCLDGCLLIPMRADLYVNVCDFSLLSLSSKTRVAVTFELYFKLSRTAWHDVDGLSIVFVFEYYHLFYMSISSFLLYLSNRPFIIKVRGSSISLNLGQFCVAVAYALSAARTLLRLWESLAAQLFHAFPSRGNHFAIYDSGHDINCNTQIGVSIKRWTHQGGCIVVSRHDKAL